MKRLLSVVVLGAMLLAACGSGSGAVAATVDGTDITVGQVESLINSDGATIEKDQFAQFLAFAIQWDLIFNAAETDFGLTVTDEEVDAETDRIYQEVATEDQSRDDFLLERGVTEEFLSNIARQGLLDTGIREILREDVAEPTPEEIDTARADAELALTEACVSHILVATEAEADAALSRLGDGEEFGPLATELSTDTGSAANNGILPCTSPVEYVEPFANAVMEATIGEVYPEPVESEFGFHVILVTDRTPPAEADLPTEEELADGVRDQAVLADLQEWFNGVMEAADVTVEEEYGTWQAVTPFVVPPAS